MDLSIKINGIRLAVLATITMVMGITSSASAAIHEFDWTAAEFGQTNGSTHNAGFIEHVNGRFNDVTNRLTWVAEFDLTQGRWPDGFFLVVNDSGNPSGIEDRYAAFYFDADRNRNSTTPGDSDGPILTVYRYDASRDSAWSTGTPMLSSLNDASFVNLLSVETTATRRTFIMDIDATPIIEFFNDQDWLGAQWDESIGVWFHPVDDLTTRYHQYGSRAGFLSRFHFCHRGSFDINDTTTTTTTSEIPEPASLGMIGAGLALVGMRRKRQAG